MKRLLLLLGTVLGWRYLRAQPVFIQGNEGDASAMADLHGRSFARGWSDGEIARMLKNPAYYSAVARIPGKSDRSLCGFILARSALDEAEIISIAVAPTMRGKGVGASLLDMAILHLAGQGINSVFLEVNEDNIAARSLYKRARFEITGSRKDYYGEGDHKACALVMQRQIG